MSEQSLTQEQSFQNLLYAQCWEDPLLNKAAFNLKGGETVAAICSAGDNVFAHLLDNPSRVLAVDLNPVQIATAKLKAAAIQVLSRDELLGFLGVQDHPDRWGMYARIQPHLSAEDQALWDARQEWIRRGIIHCGKFEGYFHLLQKMVLPYTHGRRTRFDVFEPRTRDERERFYESQWNTLRWRMLFKVFFHKRTMARFGRSSAHFAHVGDGDITRQFMDRSKLALVEMDPRANPFLQYIMHSKFLTEDGLPDYLKPGNLDIIRDRLDRVEYVHGALGDVIDQCDAGSIHAWNLSDIFEYLDEATVASLAGKIHRASAKGARTSLWNLLVRRRLSETNPDGFMLHENLSHELWMQDRAFVYGDYVVEEVI
jgi:S-adenosylmethionine-diacylglycerol 3-amino-3-carboxypropyl transferase